MKRAFPLAMMILVSLAATARSATFTVNVDHDLSAPDTELTLREAVDAANANPGADTIEFNLATPAFIQLVQGSPVIVTDDITINGLGEGLHTVRTHPTYEVFFIDTDVIAQINDLTMLANDWGSITSFAANLALRNCTCKVDEPNVTQAFRSNITHTNGELTLVNCDVVGIGHNHTMNGGGIHHTGTVCSVMDGSMIDHNNAAQFGGGIYVGPGSKLNVCNAALCRNSTTSSIDLSTGLVFIPPGGGHIAHEDANTPGSGSGGGIYNDGGDVFVDYVMLDSNRCMFLGGAICNANGGNLLIKYSTIKHNYVSFDSGGGLANIDSTAEVDSCLFAYNSCETAGGGAYNVGADADLLVVNSTFSQNQSRGAAPMTPGDGGGVFQGIDGRLKLDHCTLYLNEAQGMMWIPDMSGGYGGSLYVSDTDEVDVTVCACIIDGIATTDGNDFWDFGWRIKWFCTNVIDTDLLPLADNGGPTKTHALPPWHEAVDPPWPCPIALDQRAYVRDPIADVGAYEFGATP